MPKSKNIFESKTKKNIISIVLFLLCIGINIYFRLFPAYLPHLKDKAKDTIKHKIQDKVTDGIEALYPDYNIYAKEKLIKHLVRERLKDKEKFAQDIEVEYKKLKDKYQDDKGQTYFLGFDSYQGVYRTENVLKYGHPGTRREGDKVYDDYTLAPIGKEIGYAQSFFYLSAFLYRAFSFFFKAISLQTFLFYLPVFYALIFLSLVYLFSKRFFSHTAAFFATLFVGLNTEIIHRSVAGWFDYDMLTFIIPLLIIWFLLSALKNKYEIKKLFLYSLLASVFQGLYPLAWIGWWFILLVIGAFFLLSILDNYFFYKEGFKKANRENLYYLLCGSIFLVGSIVFCFLLTGMNLVYNLFILARESLHLGKPLSTSIWPNIYYTVSELRHTNIEKILDALCGETIYGTIIFMLSLSSMSWIYYMDKKEGKRKDFVCIMLLWFIFMGFASLNAIRFAFFLSLPLGFFLGGFISEAYPKIMTKFSSNLRLKLSTFAIFSLLVFFFLAKTFLLGFHATAHIYPAMNDGWQKALTYIKDNTHGEAILNSWWDYGSLFKTAGERRVIFDGQSQNRPVAYWMAKVILSKNEREAIRILKMLNNASDTTFFLLNRYIPDSFECIKTLESLLLLNKNNGKTFLLKRGVPEEITDEVIGNLHNRPPPAYFIVDKSMLNKISNISFLGNWDFIKLYIHGNIDRPKKEILNNLCSIFGLSFKEAERHYHEMSLTLSGKSTYESLSKRYFCGSSFEGKKDGNLLYFDNGVVYNVGSKRALVYSLLSRRYSIPKKIFIFGKNKAEEIKLEDGDFDNAIQISEAGDEYKSIILDEPLVNSLLSRLYLLKGEGLRYFEPFFMDDEAGIYVYEIKWDRFSE